MSREEARELRRRPAPVQPDLDAETEVDLGRYAAVVAARWWLPVLGLLAGIVAGYVLALGGGDVYRAQALVYLGVPLAPGGGGPVQSLATNPTFVRETVKSEAVVRRVAREAGLRPGQLRGRISVQPATATGPARTLQPSLVNVAVTGEAGGRVAAAANALARTVVDEIDDYTATKLGALRAQVEQAEAELRDLDLQVAEARRALRGGGQPAAERLVILTLLGQAQQRRTAVQQDMLQRRQELSLAQDVERPRIVHPAVARKTTAQSRRNSLVVGGAIGLLLGLVAALAWDAVAPRVRGG